MREEEPKSKASRSPELDTISEERRKIISDAAEVAAEQYLKWLFGKKGKKIPPMAIADHPPVPLHVDPIAQGYFLDEPQIEEIKFVIFPQYKISSSREEELFDSKFFPAVSKGFPKTEH